MSKFVIFADSTCDLDKALREKIDVQYTPMNYVIEGKEYVASLDWETHSAKEFYDFMRNGVLIRTTQVPAENYRRDFSKYLEEGLDILYISCSSALSGSVKTAEVVAGELMEKYKGRKVICIDSLNSSLGQGSMVIKASELRAEGKSIDEVADYIKTNRLKYNQFATVASLTYLKRAGRVTASSAFFGNLFSVKPILISDAIGQNYAIKKVKGTMASRKEIVSLVKENVENAEEQTLYISHSDALEDAEAIRDMIMSEVPFKDSYINYIAPIVGASVGPGTLGIYFVGKEVTIEGKA